MDNTRLMPIIVAFGVGITFVIFSFALTSPSPKSDIAVEAEFIDLTIADLESTYKIGHPIMFSVKAEGVSDYIACNSLSPAVAIRDGSNGKEINLNPIRFSTALLCVEPMPFDKEWTFGDDAEKEIKLDKAGSYEVVASLEDVTIEKQFIVTS
jgi:hypothetical protein